MKKNKFNPGARITIFFVTFAIIFFSLGLWQIERGQAKTVLLDEFDKNSVIDPQEIKQDSKKWERVYVEGTWYGANQILIDNVINGGIAGYKVLTPFRLNETGDLILIDRGWIKRNRNNNNLNNLTASIKLDNPLLNYWIKKLPDKLVTVNEAVEGGRSITIGSEYKKRNKNSNNLDNFTTAIKSDNPLLNSWLNKLPEKITARRASLKEKSSKDKKS